MIPLFPINLSTPSGMTAPTVNPGLYGPPAPPAGSSAPAPKFGFTLLKPTPSSGSSASGNGPQNLATWVLNRINDQLRKLGLPPLDVAAFLSANAYLFEAQGALAQQAAAGLRTNSIQGVNWLSGQLFGGASGHAGDQVAAALSTQGETSESISTSGVKVSVAGASISF